jgi:mRNA interferase YafQ
MKRKLSRANSFKRSYKKQKLSDDAEQNYIDIVYKLLNGEPLEKKYHDHQLKGSLSLYRECHIKPDLLLVYQIDDEKLELVDIGSHGELFR